MVEPVQKSSKLKRTGVSAKVIELMAVVIVVTGIGYLDYITGPNWAFSLFYFIPIIYASWRIGIFGGMLIASMAAMAWFLSEQDLVQVSLTSQQFIWRTVTRSGTFILIGLAFSILKYDRKRLIELGEQFKNLAYIDPLTKVPNRIAFLDRMTKELASGREADVPVCVILLDLDNFKRVNDTYGYETGDAVLRKVAAALRQSVRHSDMVARVSGDEFMAAIHAIGVKEAQQLVKRFSERIEDIKIEFPDANVSSTTVVAYFNSLPESINHLMNQAYQALVDAKKVQRGALGFWSSRQKSIEVIA